jgi:hypothetical protein
MCPTELTNTYLEFLDHLNAAAVHYAVLHNWESLRRGEISDIDMVVATHDFGRLETCFREYYRILNVFHYEASSFGFVLAPKDGDLSAAFIADVSTDYRWGGRIFFTDQELLRNRRLWYGYWVAGPAQEFAYLLVKKIYEKGSFPGHQRNRIRELAHDLGTEAPVVLSSLLGPKWAIWLLDRIAKEQWAAIEIHVPELRRCMRSQVLKRDRLNSLHYWAGEIQRFWDRWRYPTGASIAVVGPEATWNRTLTQALQASFSQAFRRVALFERSFGLSAKRLFVERVLLRRSTLILLECASDDLFRHKHAPQTKQRRLASLLAPVPDLVFIIGSEGSSLSQLRSHASIADVRHKWNPAMKAAKTQLNVVFLDGHLPEETIVRTVCEIFSDFLGERYSERRQIWFSNQSVT